MPAQSLQIPFTPNPKASDYDNFSPRRGRPMLFQVADPVHNRPLYPVLLALHIPPQSLSESMQKSKTVAMTYGGFIEWIWPDELDTLSADMTSGAFISPKTGLTAGSPIDALNRGRQGTIAWERQEDLLDLFRSNGKVYNGTGLPVLRGRIMCIYDRGIFAGHFTTFQVNESDDKAYTFQLNWEFKVEQVIYKYPQNANPQSSSTNVGQTNGFGSFIQPNPPPTYSSTSNAGATANNGTPVSIDATGGDNILDEDD